MRKYLNEPGNCMFYSSFSKTPYFVDKTMMLEELSNQIGPVNNKICVTRPRRFGKTVTAKMISAYFSRAGEGLGIFDNLEIAKSRTYGEYCGKYDVIHISFNEVDPRCRNYEMYINRITDLLLNDLIAEFPEAGITRDFSPCDALLCACQVYNRYFIFVLDEWDYVFHKDFSEKERNDYLEFLCTLLKDQNYVALVYMTGILPMARCSSGSALNSFTEYTMAAQKVFSTTFGFTESEVDQLYAAYVKIQKDPEVTREDLREWYYGYHTRSGERVYNPFSVVQALSNNNLRSYWADSGPFDEICHFVSCNVAAVQDDIAKLAAGIPVPAQTDKYAASSMELTTKDEIFSAMVTYGFLSSDDGYVSIPNKELMQKFQEMPVERPDLGSAKMLRA